MRLIDKTIQSLRQPMIAPGVFQLRIHALLYHRPSAVLGDNEAVQIKRVAILNRRAINFRDQPACARQSSSINPGALADGGEFQRGFTRMPAASTTDIDAKLVL